MEFVNKSLGTTFVQEGIKWQAQGEPPSVATKVLKEQEGNKFKKLPIEGKADVDEPKKKTESSPINEEKDLESKFNIHSVVVGVGYQQ